VALAGRRRIYEGFRALTAGDNLLVRSQGMCFHNGGRLQPRYRATGRAQASPRNKSKSLLTPISSDFSILCKDSILYIKNKWNETLKKTMKFGGKGWEK
jgi:hypothetical protein